jgi:hypothetical protein
LRTNKRYARSILTINGKVEFMRYVLRPKAKADRAALAADSGTSAIVPMDCYLGIAGLPFKMTAEAMLEVTFWAQNQSSYQAAEEAIFKSLGIGVNDDTVRLVSNHIGLMVFENDCKSADAAYRKLVSGELSFPDRKRPGVLYIETDGAALNTREKDNDGSTWRENKLGVVFSSDNIHFWTDKKGERQHRIGKREYVSYVGSLDEFKKHLFACAIHNGYGSYSETVILSDGATWIRNMKDALFPDAQQILDYYHLCENVSEFAKQIFSMAEAEYRPWSDRICKELKESRFENVLDEIGRLDRKLLARASFDLSGYIRNNIHNIDYAEYIRKGYFIGSGAIESGNKVVLQKRLKQAGMRWNPETAQNLLTLRAKQESGLWHNDVVIPVLRRYGSREQTLKR